jgi:hypothetical protein
MPVYWIPTEDNAHPFQQVTMDLITGLPWIQDQDVILMIVDQGCSQVAVFLPCSTTITGPGIAKLYHDHIFRWFSLPSKIISNRDPRFTSHFSRALTKKLGIEQNISMAFHLQTDGLSKRKNQWVKRYLRLVTSTAPEDWTQWLALMLAMHNNWRNTTTGLSPNQILLGYEITLNPRNVPQTPNKLAEEWHRVMMQRRAQAIEAINQAAEKMGRPMVQYAVGDQVWLEGKNLRLPYQSTKLAPKRYGPFKVIQEVSPVAYQLELPWTWGIHDIFHSSLLSPYHETTQHGLNFSWPPPELIKDEEEYEVKAIRNHRRFGHSNALQYLIKWQGYPKSNNTWELADNVGMGIRDSGVRMTAWEL